MVDKYLLNVILAPFIWFNLWLNLTLKYDLFMIIALQASIKYLKLCERTIFRFLLVYIMKKNIHLPILQNDLR